MHDIIPTKKSIKIMAKLSIGIKTQIPFVYIYGHVCVADLCLERAEREFFIMTSLREGVIIGNGSDTPFLNLPDLSYGLYQAIIRGQELRPCMKILVLKKEYHS